MHELSMALSVIRLAVEVGKENDLSHIDKIIIRKGEQCGVVEDSFCFAFHRLIEECPEWEMLNTVKIEFIGNENLLDAKAYDFFVERIEGEEWP